MSTVHVIDGITWYYKKSRICDEMTLPLRSFVWFLFDANRDYIGHWKTKKELLAFIKTVQH